MKTFGKILIAAAATTAAVVVAKKVIDEVSKNGEDSKLVNGYKKAVGTVKGLINNVMDGKPRNFSTDGYDIDFFDDDDDCCHCACDECLSDDCDDCEDCSGIHFDFDDDDELFDSAPDFVQTENAEPTDEEIQDMINEEMAKEQIDKLLSDMDSEENE